MTPELIKRVIEAALMAIHEPMSVTQLVSLFEKEDEPPGRDQIRAALKELEASQKSQLPVTRDP